MSSSRRLARWALVALAGLFVAGFGFNKKTPDEERREILEMRDEVLAMLYEYEPGARAEIERAAGYAVFSNIGLNVFVVSTARGDGVAHYNDSGKDVFMKVFSAGGGMGMGVKDFRVVFVFRTAERLDYFIAEGWQAETQADAAAKSGDEGDQLSYAIDLGPDLRMYQFTENGLALQATIQGTKYYQNDVLN